MIGGGYTEVFNDLATEFVERKSHDSTSLTNQRLVVTSCHACELSTVYVASLLSASIMLGIVNTEEMRIRILLASLHVKPFYLPNAHLSHTISGHYVVSIYSL